MQIQKTCFHLTKVSRTHRTKEFDYQFVKGLTLNKINGVGCVRGHVTSESSQANRKQDAIFLQVLPGLLSDQWCRSPVKKQKS